MGAFPDPDDDRGAVSVLDDADWLAYVESQLTDPDPVWADPDVVVGAEPGSVDDRLAAVENGISAVLEAIRCSVTSAEPGDLVEWLHRIETVRRRLPSLEHIVLEQIATRSVHQAYCQASPTQLLIDQLNLRPGQARARVKAAEQLGPRTSVTGESLAPLRPSVSVAQEAGQLSVDHAAVINDVLRRLPNGSDPATVDDLERTLVRQACYLDPRSLARVGRHAVNLLDPDGKEPSAERAHRLRGLSLTGRDDGSGRLRADLTPECLAVWRAVIDAIGSPAPASDRQHDPRTAAQRAHDAFLDAGKALLRIGELPDCGGVPATIIVTVDVDDLARRAGYATTAHGDLWPVADMLDGLADRAEWVTVFGSKTDGVLANGTDRRFASPGQTKALIARDGGCTFPGCTVPASWCDRHHVDPVVPRRNGDPPGPTDVGNMALVCGPHHAWFEQAGWACVMIDGRPHWIPPGWIDPSRTPRRNTYWHPDG